MNFPSAKAPAAVLLALALLALAALPAWAQPAEEEAQYKRAKADYVWLVKNPRAGKVYQNWQTLIDRFTRVYTSNPRGKFAPGSLYWMGRLHSGAYLHFKRASDRDRAVDAFRRLIRRFPRSRLADDAQFLIGKLFEDAGDLKQAYIEYLRVTVNHPRGDQNAPAKKRLDALEAKLLHQPDAKPAPGRPRAARRRPAGVLVPVTGLRQWSTPNYSRVVLTLERPTPYTAKLLKRDPAAGKPRRLYLELKGARLAAGAKKPINIGNGLLRRARAGQYNPDTVRLVLDIKRLASYKVFTLDNPFRVVVDCFGDTPRALAASKKAAAKKAAARARRRRRVSRGRAKGLPPEVGLAAALGLGVRKVVLDPGHGGKDPGALWRGLKEKDLVLDIAKRIAPKLRKLLGCQVLLTRRRDRFLPLEHRTAFANTNDADIFVSLHLNAAVSHKLRGIETYFLNLASDEESMRVAARENATTKRSISDLQVILNDLMLNSKINESHRLARSLQKRLVGSMRKRYRKVRDLKVKQAPFYVLIGARMPAVLVEMGFITNPAEHRRLASARYRDRLAAGVARGIADYVKQLKTAGR